MSKMSRREFIGTAIAATGACAVGGAVISRGLKAGGAARISAAFVIDRSVKSPTDRVRLGKSGLKVSLVGVGTGTIGYARRSNQTQLGQEEFTRLMRHALDRGINFFDLADSYGTNPFFARAMKDVARDRYVVQTKTDSTDKESVAADVDRFLKELETDYIDSVLIHCVTDPDWTTRYRGAMDALSEAKRRGKIRAHGVTCHSFGALEAAAASDWVELNQVRWNPRGSHMDAEVETARALFHRMRARGQGMIGMKVVGQGDIVRGERPAARPEECFRFQVESGVVDAFVVGVEQTAHIDQMISGTQLALNEVGYRVVQAA